MTMKKILLATTAIAVSLQPVLAINTYRIEPISAPYLMVQTGDEANLLNAALAELDTAVGALADATSKGEGVEAAQARVDQATQAVKETQANFEASKAAEQSAPEPKVEEVVPKPKIKEIAPEIKSEDAPATDEAPKVEEVPKVQDAPEPEKPVEAEVPKPDDTVETKEIEDKPAAQEDVDVPQTKTEEAVPEPQAEEVTPAVEELKKIEEVPAVEEAPKIEEEPKAQDAAESEKPVEAEVPKPDDTVETKEVEDKPAAQEDVVVPQTKTEEAVPEPQAEEVTPAIEELQKIEEAPKIQDTAESEKPDDTVEVIKAEDKPAAQEDVAAPVTEIDVKEPVVEAAPVAEQIKNADEKPITILPDNITEEDKAALAVAETKRREESRKRRNELLGAAAVGVAVGVLVPLLGGKLVEDQGDRVVIERNGEYFIRKDENALLRRDGVRVDYEELDNGLSREIMTRPNGVQILTTRAPNGDILRRERLFPNGDVTVLIDSLDQRGTPRRNYREELPPLELTIDRGLYVVQARDAGRERIRDTFIAPPVEIVRERYSLRDVRASERLRETVRRLDLDAIQFDTGSATVRQGQIPFLEQTALAIADVINQDPSSLFLIEGHTDAVGGDIYNLALSDRRAETVARILIDSYGLPPENFIVEGYGEAYLKVNSQGDEPQNRRVAIRNITPLLTAKN